MSNTSSSLRGVDPAVPGTIIRGAFAVESVFTVGFGVYLTFFPRHFLLQNLEVAAAQASTTAAQIVQQYGSVNILAGVVVGLMTSNKRISIESRPIFYRIALAWEICHIALLLWQGYTMEGGIPRKSSLNSAWMFVPFIAWRIYTLGWKPEWFGRYLEGKKLE